MQILVVSLLHPLPTNPSRGVFVDDHIQLIRNLGHDVKVVNPLPWMPKYAEARRSTMIGVAKTPKKWMHEGHEILVPRYVAFPDHPYPRLTQHSITRKSRWIERQLGQWRPEVIICHTLWPCGHLAQQLAQRWAVPWVGVVHGHDFDVGLLQSPLTKHIQRLVQSCQHLVCVTKRLEDIAHSLASKPTRASTIPCVTEINAEWRRSIKPSKKGWRKDSIDILFPADPRRPEKRHLLALQTGEELEQRGWIVGITSLRQQPRNIVYDRMLIADVALITSTREASPLVAREALLCGTPVVGVAVGELDNYLPKSWICEPTPQALADGIEHALQFGWPKAESVEEVLSFCQHTSVSQAWSALLASLVE